MDIINTPYRVDNLPTKEFEELIDATLEKVKAIADNHPRIIKATTSSDPIDGTRSSLLVRGVCDHSGEHNDAEGHVAGIVCHLTTTPTMG